MCASARNVNIGPTPTQKLTYAHGLLWHVAPKTDKSRPTGSHDPQVEHDPSGVFKNVGSPSRYDFKKGINVGYGFVNFTEPECPLWMTLWMLWVGDWQEFVGWNYATADDSEIFKKQLKSVLNSTKGIFIHSRWCKISEPPLTVWNRAEELGVKGGGRIFPWKFAVSNYQNKMSHLDSQHVHFRFVDCGFPRWIHHG